MAYKRTADDLLADLKRLRKGKGFVPAHLLTAGLLAQWLGGKDFDLETIRWRFVDAINQLAQREDRTLLLAIYGLEEGYAGLPTLSARRAKFSKEVAHVGEDTLLSREEAALLELSAVILNHYTNVDLANRVELPHPHRLILEHRITTTLINGLPSKEMHELTLLPFYDGWRPSDNYYGFTLPAFITVKPLRGIREVSSTSYSGRGSQHILTFNEKLKRNLPFSFAFETFPKGELSQQPNINPSQLAEQMGERISFSGKSITEPTRQLTVTLSFQGKMPRELWWYKNKTRIARPGQPSESNRLLLNEDQSVSKTLTTLYSGYSSGIAWRW